MRRSAIRKFDFKDVFLALGSGVSEHFLGERSIVYNQGDIVAFLFYITSGQVKLVAFSTSGKEAITGIYTVGQFFGEDCLVADHSRRLTDAVAIGQTTILKIEKRHIVRLLRDNQAFASEFVNHLLSRSKQIEENLIDQLFNSTEKRLARTLLLLANFGSDDAPLAVIPNISQASLAQMVGASRPRVSEFLKKFRDLGFIEYNGEFRINRTLIKVLLKD